MTKERHIIALAILLLVALVSFPFIVLKLPDGGPLIPLSLIVMCIVALALVIPRRPPHAK